MDFYEDAGISGSNGREKRPGLDRLLKDATSRKIDMIAAWSVDRLSRSLQLGRFPERTYRHSIVTSIDFSLAITWRLEACRRSPLIRVV